MFDYGTDWLDDAIRRAAHTAGHDDFPFVEDIRSGVVTYLETKCTLKLLQLEDLYDRIRRMLEKIGCERIAEKLEPVAPPLTISLVNAATAAGNGFELAFFQAIRKELTELRDAGAGEIHFTGLRECSLILRGATKWNKECDALLAEMEAFLRGWDKEDPEHQHPMRLCLEG